MAKKIEMTFTAQEAQAVQSILNIVRAQQRLENKMRDTGTAGNRAGRRIAQGWQGVGRQVDYSLRSMAGIGSASMATTTAAAALAREWDQIKTIQEEARTTQLDVAKGIQTIMQGLPEGHGLNEEYIRQLISGLETMAPMQQIIGTMESALQAGTVAEASRARLELGARFVEMFDDLDERQTAFMAAAAVRAQELYNLPQLPGEQVPGEAIGTYIQAIMKAAPVMARTTDEATRNFAQALTPLSLAGWEFEEAARMIASLAQASNDMTLESVRTATTKLVRQLTVEGAQIEEAQGLNAKQIFDAIRSGEEAWANQLRRRLLGALDLTGAGRSMEDLAKTGQLTIRQFAEIMKGQQPEDLRPELQGEVRQFLFIADMLQQSNTEIARGSARYWEQILDRQAQSTEQTLQQFRVLQQELRSQPMGMQRQEERLRQTFERQAQMARQDASSAAQLSDTIESMRRNLLVAEDVVEAIQFQIQKFKDPFFARLALTREDDAEARRRFAAEEIGKLIRQFLARRSDLVPAGARLVTDDLDHLLEVLTDLSAENRAVARAAIDVYNELRATLPENRPETQRQEMRQERLEREAAERVPTETQLRQNLTDRPLRPEDVRRQGIADIRESFGARRFWLDDIGEETLEQYARRVGAADSVLAEARIRDQMIRDMNRERQRRIAEALPEGMSVEEVRKQMQSLRRSGMEELYEDSSFLQRINPFGVLRRDFDLTNEFSNLGRRIGVDQESQQQLREIDAKLAELNGIMREVHNANMNIASTNADTANSTREIVNQSTRPQQPETASSPTEERPE